MVISANLFAESRIIGKQPIGRLVLNGLFAAAVAGMLLSAGCAPANPQTPSATSIPQVQVPPPPTADDLGKPAATFSVLPTEPNRESGVGTLSYQGKHYHLSAQGLSAGRVGNWPGPVVGKVYALGNLRDINGTYTVSAVSNGKEVVLTNPQGVTIHLSTKNGVEKGLSSMRLRLATWG